MVYVDGGCVVYVDCRLDVIVRVRTRKASRPCPGGGGDEKGPEVGREKDRRGWVLEGS